MRKFKIFAAVAAVGGLFYYVSPPFLGGLTACLKWRHYAAIKEETLSRLTAPASAEFSSMSGAEFTKLDPIGDFCVFRVHAHVDAQNAFGAMVRSNITARTVGYDAGPYLLDLTITQRP